MWGAKALVKGTIISCLVAGTFTALIGGTVYHRISGTDVDASKVMIQPKPTVVYDKNGDVLARFSQDRKQKTSYSEIPEEMIEAVVATEDRDFFQHVGINPKGIARAIIVNHQAGETKQGGSTITQQVVKQLYVGSEKSYSRKIKEAILATSLEKEVSKEEIITAYLSHNDFGYQSFGIKNAVETYFGESLSDLKNESRMNRILKTSFLAGLLQAPYGYSPYDTQGNKRQNLEVVLNRRNTVLHNMLNQKYITKDEYNTAIQNKDLLVLDKPKREHESDEVKYSEFVQYALDETANLLNLKGGAKAARYAGMKIYTSFDPDVYNNMRKQFDDPSMFPQNAKDGTQVEGSAVFLNPQNGEIYALTGGRTVPGFLQGLNRAYQSDRQPGSTFKPLISYGPALEKGLYTPSSLLNDRKGTVFPGGYVVKDWDKGNRRSVTMTEALRESWNIPAVWTLQQVGIPYATEYISKLGIKLTAKDNTLPIALGGLDKGVSTLEMADAYQAYANGGYRIEAHAVRRLVDANDDIVYEAPSKLTEEDRVIKETTATQMKQMLRNVVKNGTGAKAGINAPDQMIAGKTGTTEFTGTDGNTDAWFVGFTKDYVGAIWLGYDSTDQNHYLLKADGSGRPAALFGQIITPLLKNNPDPESDYAPITTKIKVSSDIPKVDTLKVKGTLDSEKKQVTLQWDVENNTRYKVYRDGKELATVTNGEYKDTTVQEGKVYTYSVSGYDGTSGYKTFKSNSLTYKVEAKKEEVFAPIEDGDGSTDSTNANDTTDTTNTNSTDATETP